MKKWSINYLLFSLMLLFGINFYSDKAYAATSWCPSTNPACVVMGPVLPGANNEPLVSVQDSVTCTYKINDKSKPKNTTAPNTIEIVRTLVPTNLNSDNNVIEYKINDYYNGVQLSKISSYGDKNYYKKTFDCPNSFVFYSSTFNRNGKTEVYFSKVKDGSSSWDYKKNEVSVYSIESKKPSGNKISLISQNSCTFTNEINSNQTINLYTEFDNDDLKMYIRYSGYAENKDGKWTIRNKNNITGIKTSFSSGKCSDFNYLYYNKKKKGLAFLDHNTLNNNANDFDGTDGDYEIFVNSTGRELLQKRIDNASAEWDNVNSDYDKYCEESSSQYNKEKCNEVEDKLKEVANDIKSDCSNLNKLSDEYKTKCQNLNTNIDKKSDETGIDLSQMVEITCETLGELRDKLQTYFTLIKFLTPVLIIGLTVVDYVQATTSGDDDALKKANSKFAKRLIIGVVIFLLPSLVDIALQLIDDYQISTCGIK